MPRVADGENLLLGRGKVYFNQLVATLGTGERFLGNCMAFERKFTDTTVEAFSSADATGGLLKSSLARRAAEITIHGNEFSKENIALALLGDVSLHAQGAASITNEAFTNVYQGRWYKLLYRNVSAVTVTGPSGTPTYTLTTDYLVDAETGRIYIVEGGGITDATGDIEVDYTYSAYTKATIRAGTQPTIEGFLRFIGEPAEGPTYEVEVWKVSIRSDAALALINDDYAEWSLQASVIADYTNHPNEPWWRETLRAA
jgi:hypothetical protein